MSLPQLEALTISDFRSVRETIVIPLNAPVVLLYGTNGAGKTTVMSALELALTGDISEVTKADRQHLINRNAKEGSVELSSSAGTVGYRLNPASIEGTPLLEQADARFFTERSYLAQRTLGQLLDIYEDAEHGESPLTRFVKDLLRLDELDALIDGLEPVRDRRLVKRLVPELADADRHVEAVREQIREAKENLSSISREADALRAEIREHLDHLHAPPKVVEALERGDAVEQWLEAHDGEAKLVELVSARRELAGIRDRRLALSNAQATRDSSKAEREEAEADRNFDRWWAASGSDFEAVLKTLGQDFPAIPFDVASSDPASLHANALAQVTEEIKRLRLRISKNDAALQQAAQLEAKTASTRARLDVIDDQLASSNAPSVAEELGRVLASLIPHIHTDDCPVCGRDFSEVSAEPLSAHLAAEISKLGEEAARLSELSAARLQSADLLRMAEEENARLNRDRIEPADLVAAKASLRRLEIAEKQLSTLTKGVSKGAAVIRRKVATHRARTLRREEDRASVELRIVVASLISSLGQPQPDDSTSLEDMIDGLMAYIESEIVVHEAQQKARQTAVQRIHDLRDNSSLERQARALIKKADASLARSESRIAELGGKREAMKNLRAEAEANRTRIVRSVFNKSLNRMWRDLFVRLAPREPFVPAFRVPETPGEAITARLETVHRDGKPGGSPGAMLSAGNLNTAALTLFLALHLTAKPRLPWLLLDDPVQSMDEVHVSQFAALLRALARDHGRRIVIAVHELALFEYLALELSPAQAGDSLITVELSSSWSGVTTAHPDFVAFKEDIALTSA